MRFELVLLAGDFAQAKLPKDMGSQPEALLQDGQAGEADSNQAVQIRAHWNLLKVPKGEISIPAELNKRLLAIRAEHEAWAYEMGYLPLKTFSGRKSDLQTQLKAGSELSMWWCSLIYERHPKMTPNLYPIYKLRCLELILCEKGCTALKLVGGDAKLRMTLEQFCARSGMRFSALDFNTEKGKSSLGQKLYAACPAPLRAMARYAHWFWTVRRKLPFVGKDFQPKRLPGECGRHEKQAEDHFQSALIATYFPNIDLHAAGEGRFRSRYWESLHDALNDEAAWEHPHGPHFVHWLFIRFPSPELSLNQCISLRDLFQREGRDGLSFHYLEEFLSAKDLWLSWLRWLKLFCRSLLLERKAAQAACLKESKLNFWFYIQKDWAESFRGWRCLERCLQNRAMEHYLRLLGPQRWILFPLENCPWERMLTCAARKQVPAGQQGRIIGAQHSSIRPTDFRYFDDPRTFASTDCAIFQPDKICGNGDSACAQWRNAGVPQAILGQVEALRYLYLAEAKKSITQVSDKAREAAENFAGLSASPKSRKCLLLLTSFFRDETDELLSLFAECLKAGLLPDWQILVKPHPYLPVEKCLRELLGADFERISLIAGPMALALSEGTTVWAANSTTAALEAALRSLPLMVMQSVNDFDLCPIQDLPGLARTGTLDDVRRLLPGLGPTRLPKGYLDLDPALPRWKAQLGLKAGNLADTG